MKIAKEVTHCTVHETKVRMSTQEYRRWGAFFQLEAEEMRAGSKPSTGR